MAHTALSISLDPQSRAILKKLQKSMAKRLNVSKVTQADALKYCVRVTAEVEKIPTTTN